MHKVFKIGLGFAAAFVMNMNFAFGMSGDDGDYDDERRPPEHKCPITWSPMKNPVIAADGFSYDKTAIEQHFQHNGLISPLTNVPLSSARLVDNEDLKKAINEWDPAKDLNQQENNVEKRQYIFEKPSMKEVLKKLNTLVEASNDSDKSFLKISLIYKEYPGSNYGKRELPVAELQNPKKSFFDLSDCGKMKKYFSISTGCDIERTNDNTEKVEIRIFPLFGIKEKIQGASSRLENKIRKYDVKQNTICVLFYCGGGSDSDSDFYDYIITESDGDLFGGTLYQLWINSEKAPCLKKEDRPFRETIKYFMRDQAEKLILKLNS